MADYVGSYRDFPLPSVEDLIWPEDVGYTQIDSTPMLATQSESPLFVSPGSPQVYGISDDTDLSYGSFGYSDSDRSSTFSASDGDEVGQIAVLDQRHVGYARGGNRQYLVRCWIDERHMALLTELAKLQSQ
ncbi:hypothetical protein BJX96DRAFT_157089 [Aspergillus floccosus]